MSKERATVPAIPTEAEVVPAEMVAQYEALASESPSPLIRPGYTQKVGALHTKRAQLLNELEQVNGSLDDLRRDYDNERWSRIKDIQQDFVSEHPKFDPLYSSAFWRSRFSEPLQPKELITAHKVGVRLVQLDAFLKSSPIQVPIVEINTSSVHISVTGGRTNTEEGLTISKSNTQSEPSPVIDFPVPADAYEHVQTIWKKPSEAIRASDRHVLMQHDGKVLDIGKSRMTRRLFGPIQLHEWMLHGYNAFELSETSRAGSHYLFEKPEPFPGYRQSHHAHMIAIGAPAVRQAMRQTVEYMGEDYHWRELRLYMLRLIAKHVGIRVNLK